MKLIGNLKKQVEKAETKEEKKSLIENAGMLINDAEMEMVSGGRSSKSCRLPTKAYLYVQIKENSDRHGSTICLYKTNKILRVGTPILTDLEKVIGTEAQTGFVYSFIRLQSPEGWIKAECCLI